MNLPMDPRITPARKDLAAEHLRGRVEAVKYVPGIPYRITVDGVDLRFSPDSTARTESQLIFGETFVVYDRNGDWCWGQSARDDYVGYVPTEALSAELHEPTHLVATRSSHLYPEPDLKQPPLGLISMTAPVQVVGTEGGYSRLAGGEWIFSKHLVSLQDLDRDYIAHAWKFVGTPYLWGGRSCRGIDCSAFVQLALCLAGHRAPRDSDLQAATLGDPVPQSDPGDFNAIEPGDLVFFPGHVGIYLGGWQFLHANAFDMQVSLHRFSDVLDRANAAKEGVTAIRRIVATGAGF